MISPASQRSVPIAWNTLLILVAAKIGIHALLSGPLAWGYMTDELYLLDSLDRLDWGFVDHPPLSVALLLLVRMFLGDSIVAIRILPALFSAAIVLITGLLARELGGGKTAQPLAALAALVTPVYLAMGSYHSMNPIDQALWAVGMLLFARILNGSSDRLWIPLGFVVGLGLLNKIGMLWFGAGIAAGLLLTPDRRRLATRWPWIAGLIAVGLFAPFVLWQWHNDWPFLEFSRNAALHKIGFVSPLKFFLDQILVMNPVTAPLWMAGLVFCFATAAGSRHRPIAWISVTTFVILAVSGSARVHYLAPVFPILFAAGSVLMERLATSRPWLPRTAIVTLITGGLVSLPITVPIFSPPVTEAYQEAIGLSPPQELEGSGRLPLIHALSLHAVALLDAVSEVYRRLPPEDRARATILTGSFGETGAINVLGPKLGLPPSIGTHNQYWLWGPGDATGELMIVVHEPGPQLSRWFRNCERAAEIECPYCMPLLDAKAVFVCREPRRSLRELWPEMKLYR